MTGRPSEQADTLPFLKLLAHDLRWDLVRCLARSDLRVGELTALAGHTGNLVSYHLQQLRTEGLVRERRSSADAREVYYSLDLDRFATLLTATASTVHPRLLARDEPPPPARGRSKPAILFLCTHNSARSQMAEGLLRARGGGGLTVTSAGSDPTELHPLAVEAMRRMNTDISGHRTRNVEDLVGKRFDFVITVCDSVRERCPTFANSPELIHWSIADPAQAGTLSAMRSAFHVVAQELERRTAYLIVRVLDGLRATALK